MRRRWRAGRLLPRCWRRTTTRVRARAWLLAFGLIALVLAGRATAATQHSLEVWAYLGPAGPVFVQSVAVAPRWPEDRLILAARRDDLVRSPDGGHSWERLPLPGETVLGLHLVDTPTGRVALALLDRNPQRLLRSTDDGASWQPVLEPPGSIRVVPSPSSAVDGLLLVLSDGHLFRSDDAGATWHEQAPAPGQRIQQAVFSPDFATDRFIALAAISDSFPPLFNDRPADRVSDDHERSAGILISTDGGQSWAPANSGLGQGEVPYRHVESLAISPTFARDGTLFAGAWGPRQPVDYAGGKIRAPTFGTFRSRDRGATWEPVGAPTGRQVEVALSPTFADDGIALAAASNSFATPASSTCRVSRTADGGETWTEVIRPGSYESCSDVRLLKGRSGLLAVVRKGGGWSFSLDGGQAWAGLDLPSGGQGFPVLSPPPPDGRAPLVAIGTGTGVWAGGTDVERTQGSLPCPAEAVAGFGRIFRDEVGVRARFGCPLSPEEPARLRVALADEGGALQVGDTPERWIELTRARSQPGGWWSERTTAEQPLPADAVPVDGVRQAFEGGTLYFFERPGGARTILAVSAASWWQDFPD